MNYENYVESNESTFGFTMNYENYDMLVYINILEIDF